MDQYCVVMYGLQAEASDEPSAWLPVAAALKLDQPEFERRVVAALPRIVRTKLDQATAERIAQLLQAMHVDARVLPDDPQLAYIDRAGAICGPLPQSSLGDFIQPGESYRLRGDTAWQVWLEPEPEPVEQAPIASSTLTIEFDDLDDIDDAAPWLSAGDEAVDAMPTSETLDEVGDPTSDELAASADDESQQAMSTPPHFEDEDDSSDTTQEVLPTDADDGEPHRVMPPPLPPAPTVQDEPEAEPSGDPEAAASDADVDRSIDHGSMDHGSMDDGSMGDDSMDESDLTGDETLSTVEADASTTTAPETAEAHAPRRSRAGRLIVLLVLVVLAMWAYRHWISDTRVEGSPAASTVTEPADPASGQPAAPGPMVPGSDFMPAPVSGASVAPAASSSDVAAATSTPAPAVTTAVLTNAVPSGATTASPVASSTPAPATTDTAAATATADSPGRLPASAGTILPAPSAPATAAEATEPAAH